MKGSKHLAMPVLLLQFSLIIISFRSYSQRCIYTDPNILIVNCGEDDRYKLSQTVFELSKLDPRVIVLDFIFFDKRAADSLFIKNLFNETPVVLSMGNKNDSSYFSLPNCHYGPRSIGGNDVDSVEFLYPLVRRNEKLRDSFELLVLKYFDPDKYSKMKKYLGSFDLSKSDVKAKIEFNGNSISCFHYITINDLKFMDKSFINGKIIILGYFGNDADKPLKKDKDRFAFKVRSTDDNKRAYMYTTLISANIISNLIRKEIQESDLNKGNINLHER